MKQILVIVFPIFLRPFLGEFNPAVGLGGPGAGTAASAGVPAVPVVAPARGRGAATSGTRGAGGDGGDGGGGRSSGAAGDGVAGSAAARGRALLGWPAGEMWLRALQRPRQLLASCFHANPGIPPNGLLGERRGDGRGGPGELNPSRLCCPWDVPTTVTLPGCVTQTSPVVMGRSQGLGPCGVVEQEQHLLPAAALSQMGLWCRGLEEGIRLPLLAAASDPGVASRG